MLRCEAMTYKPTDKILVLIKAADGDHDFVCPNCNGYVIRLKGANVADLTDPETYALTSVMNKRQKDYFLGVPVSHNGRLGDDKGFCRNKFYFWDIHQGLVRVQMQLRIVGTHAAV